MAKKLNILEIFLKGRLTVIKTTHATRGIVKPRSVFF